MSIKPIKYEETKTAYKCPVCNESSSYEDEIKKHIYTKHTYPSLEKEVKLYGTMCEFKSEEQAKMFIQSYCNHRSDWDNSYKWELKWKGPGKYHFIDTMERDFHFQSDLGREYLLTFHRFLGG